MLVISPRAAEDLADIYRYGTQHWGEGQAAHYLDMIKDQIWTLTRHPEIGAQRDNLLSHVRSLPTRSHIIFYRYSKATVEVIRILQSRQDPERHIHMTTQLT